MPEIRTSDSMSGEGKRSDATWPKPPRPSSTLLCPLRGAVFLQPLVGEALGFREIGRPRYNGGCEHGDGVNTATLDIHGWYVARDLEGFLWRHAHF